MKKIVYFAAACVALVACSKEIDESATVNATAFEEGQKVVLTVGTNDQTKVSSALDATTGAIDFKWETGDKIKVTVNSQSAEFTLKSGAGESTATFEGTMPAAGNTFDVQYPVTDPDLTSQTYVANALPKDKLKMAATGCTIADGFTLTPQNAALRLNLYGLNREVSQIVVTDKTANPNVSYTLTCSNAVRVGNSAATATPFLLVVPGGASWIFNVEVTAGNATANPDPVPSYTEGSYTGDATIVTSGAFTTSSAQTFTAGQILNMPAKLISAIWAPVNCGYDATNYKLGKLYQFGRVVGGGYASSDAGGVVQIAENSASVSGTANSNPSDNVFYRGNPNYYDWYIHTSDNSKRLSSWPLKSGDFGYVNGKIANPCPSGWRVPTYDELKALIGNADSINSNPGGWDATNKGYWYNGTTSPKVNEGMFLPAAGQRSVIGEAQNRGEGSFYWSSSVGTGANSHFAYYLYGGDRDSAGKLRTKASMGCNGRAFAFSIRCVLE